MIATKLKLLGKYLIFKTSKKMNLMSVKKSKMNTGRLKKKKLSSTSKN
jgi:hypothetical protein